MSQPYPLLWTARLLLNRTPSWYTSGGWQIDWIMNRTMLGQRRQKYVLLYCYLADISQLAIFLKRHTYWQRWGHCGIFVAERTCRFKLFASGGRNHWISYVWCGFIFFYHAFLYLLIHLLCGFDPLILPTVLILSPENTTWLPQRNLRW